jgi:hypothetical protein
VDNAFAAFKTDEIGWYENDNSMVFTKNLICTVEDGATSVDAIDIDGDGDLDALSTACEGNEVHE